MSDTDKKITALRCAREDRSDTMQAACEYLAASEEWHADGNIYDYVEQNDTPITTAEYDNAMVQFSTGASSPELLNFMCEVHQAAIEWWIKSQLKSGLNGERNIMVFMPIGFDPWAVNNMRICDE